MSLVDQSLVPYQRAYVLIVFQMVLILGGNCAYVSRFSNFVGPQPKLKDWELHSLFCMFYAFGSSVSVSYTLIYSKSTTSNVRVFPFVRTILPDSQSQDGL